MHYNLVTLREQRVHCTVPNTYLVKEQSEHQETHLNELLCLKTLVTIPNMIVLPYCEILAVSGNIAKHVNNLKVGVVRKGVT